MRTMKTCALATALALAVPSAAHGQRPQTREGFWISFGPGGGSATFECDQCGAFPDELKGGGATFHIRLGGTPSPQVLLGGEISGWAKDEAGVESAAAIMAGVVYYYPSATGGAFVKAGLGFTAYAADDNVDEFTSSGVGLILGAGYDIRVARNFSLTPVVNLIYGGGGDWKLNGNWVADNFRQTVIEFALGFTFH